MPGKTSAAEYLLLSNKYLGNSFKAQGPHLLKQQKQVGHLCGQRQIFCAYPVHLYRYSSASAATAGIPNKLRGWIKLSAVIQPLSRHWAKFFLSQCKGRAAGEGNREIAARLGVRPQGRCCVSCRGFFFRLLRTCLRPFESLASSGAQKDGRTRLTLWTVSLAGILWILRYPLLPAGPQRKGQARGDAMRSQRDKLWPRNLLLQRQWKRPGSVWWPGRWEQG